MKNFTLIVLIISFTSCVGQKPEKTVFKAASESDGCKLPDTKWLRVVNGYDSKATIELATKFEAAAKADAERIKNIGVSEANASSSFKSDFLKIATSNSQQIVEVSQEFYEAYRAKRDALCSLLFLLDRPNISNETRNNAEKQFLGINESWSKVKDDEKKKILSH